MSNPELNPTETVCEKGNPDASRIAAAPIEIITPREVPLGGVRAMTVRRTIPQRKRSLIGAWCFLDHYGPDHVSDTGGMNVPAHPHIGLQTVSWLFAGEIEHRDSAGYHAFVRPGEMNLMTAGHGISHSERSTPDTGMLHGAQLWVVLPEAARHGEKTFEHYVPQVLTGEGWQAQVFLGELFGDRSPVSMFTPLVGAEIRLEAGGTLTIDVQEAFEHGVLVDTGEITVSTSTGGADEPVAKDHLGYIAPGASTVTITAGSAATRLIFIGGEPFPEQIVMWWNFIGRDHAEIAQARADWQKQIEEVGMGDPGDPTEASREGVIPALHRFGLPDDEPELPLPAPKLPIARLVPRQQ